MLNTMQTHRNLADLPDFCTLADFAVVLGISKATAYRMAEQERIPCIRLGKRIILSKKHLEQWIDQEIEYKLDGKDREDIKNG